MISLDGGHAGTRRTKKKTRLADSNMEAWSAPYGDDEILHDKVVRQELEPADYLLGRKTFKIWAGYWPQHGDFWPGINAGMKYVFSKRMKNSDPLVTGWKNSVLIKNVADIKKLKNSKGSDIHVWGSSKLVQLLFKNDLVDELRLKIHPLTLGKGKKLFGRWTDSCSIYIN